MQGAGFKAVIIFLMLSIMAFIAGSLAADSASSALVPTLLVVGVFFLLYLGKNAWALVFIVPSVLSVLNFDILQKLPVGNMIAGVVLFYILLMAMMGHQRLRWNGIFYFDIIFLIFYVYFLYSWVRHPVTLREFTSVTDYGYDQQLGGSVYVLAIASIFPFLVVSVIDQKLEKILFVLKLAFWITMAFSIFSMFRNYGELLNKNEAVATYGESRISVFSHVGLNVINFLLCHSSFFGILMAPWKLMLAGAAAIGVLWSGARMEILLILCTVLWVSYFKRQLLWLFCLALCTWGGLVYLSYQTDFETLPNTARRVLTAVPGIKIDETRVGDAYNSINWRLKMWELAFDAEAGYIQDYTFGDGFGYSTYRERIRFTADSYGLINVEVDYRQYAYTGGWHNGVVTAIHRIGYVGLVLMVWFILAALCVIFSVYKSFPNVKNRVYGLYYIVFAFASAVHVLAVHGFNLLFEQFVFIASIGKLLYCSLREEGYMKAITTKGKYYVPLLMRKESEPESL